MSSLVLELQRNLIEKNINIVELLHKALLLSGKLNLDDIKKWIGYELDGYNNSKFIPEYRTIDGTFKRNDPIHGWQTVVSTNQKFNKIVTKSTINQKISEIVSLIGRDDGQLAIPKTHLVGEYFPSSEVSFFVDKSRLIGIIDSIRKIILEWTIELEKKGILGEGLSFTKDEIAEAKDSSIIINLTGNDNNLQIQQNTSNSHQSVTQYSVDLAKVSEMIQLIEKHLNDVEMDSENKEIVVSEISTVKEELKSTEPKSSIIKSSFSHIRNLLEGVAGGIVTSGLIHHLDLFK